MVLLDTAISTWNSKDALLLVLGSLLGGGASFLVWWVVTHLLVPSLSYSKAISRITITVDREERVQYRIKLANRGKRNIIDVELFVRLYLHVSPGTRTITVVNVKLSQPRLPLMPYGGLMKIIKLLPERTEAFSKHPFPEHVWASYATGSLSLEEVLALDARARIQILGFGYDSFSGSRRLWQQEYKASDVHERLFKSGSLELKEATNTEPEIAATTPAVTDTPPTTPSMLLDQT